MATGVLSTKQRCNRCGLPVRNPPPDVCPNCQTELNEENLSSELKEWGQTRRRGRARFILLRGVLPFSLMGVAWFSRMWSEPARSWGWMVISLGGAIACGLLFGCVVWRGAEKQYRQSEQSEVTRR